MCGLAGIVNLKGGKIRNWERAADAFSELLAHRGPDASSQWLSPKGNCLLAHRRLSILDLSNDGTQPMHGRNSSVLVQNGEIYNYQELRRKYRDRRWISETDTETILASYEARAFDCVHEIEGMFAFAVWDESEQTLFAARDRVGIKPFYYAVVGETLIFASEIKAILPFLENIETDSSALGEYISFQYTIGENTLFSGVKQLMPGHSLIVRSGQMSISKYWDLSYEKRNEDSAEAYDEKLRSKVTSAIESHLQTDVPLGTYLSGGVDSSLVATLATKMDRKNNLAFHGKFTDFPGYDESVYAEEVAAQAGIDLEQITITADDFTDNISNIIYHLDQPVAGPGSFPQYMVSKLASEHVKVVLGGQGGDELFGGYARYLIAYLEQVLRATIDGTYSSRDFPVSFEAMAPNLAMLKEYKPLISSFFADNLFGEIDDRYFRLTNRSNDFTDEFNWNTIDLGSVQSRFKNVFNGGVGIGEYAYFDKVMHFDFKCLLPALLHVEDRMSMAHGIESRVPILDHRVAEFSASVPTHIKFPGGKMKHMLKSSYGDILPTSLVNRRDKMGFPVPLSEWYKTDLKDFVLDIFGSQKSINRDIYNANRIRDAFQSEATFSRKTWAFLSLELWQQQFHDQHGKFKALVC